MSNQELPLSYSYTGMTRNIRVSVQPEFLEQESDPMEDIYAFAYTIKIENLGGEMVQLLERHWIIESNGVCIAEVVGPGVIGLQPAFKAGEDFVYTSSVVIQDPIGCMRGSYTFRSVEGSYFEVVIPQFDLFFPVLLH